MTTATEENHSKGQIEKWLGVGSGRVPLRPLVLLLYLFPLLVPSRLSLSLPSGARGVMGRRKVCERERGIGNPVSYFTFPSPPAPAERVTRR